MKLDYRRTMLVGLAFLSISAFWQMYDNIIPLILQNTFGILETEAGFIMSLDNILALFLLPFFGAWSDRRGRRMPFILLGTAAAVVSMLSIPLAAGTRSLLFFFAALGVVLVAMGSYRSPAVALMPDVTPKPLRSKANAVINLMGALGGVYTLAVTSLLMKKAEAGAHADYTPVFLAVAGLMVVAVAALRLTVNEHKLAAGAHAAAADGPAEPQAEEGKKLPPEVTKSLALILASVALWFMGYNAVTTAFTRYAGRIWGQNVSQASNCLMVATVGAVLSYIPIGFISSKIGRKKTILIGIVLLSGCFAFGAFAANRFTFALYVMFALVGFAWAAINVNSYPMVVEISRIGDVGKYTGYYYIFSMSAQIVTPIVSGWLLEHVGYHTLFPYAALMVALAFLTMSLTRHGDNKPEKKQSRLEAFDIQD